MAESVQIHSTDDASGATRTITLVKRSADTLSAFYEASSNPGDVKKFDLSHVKANANAGTISVTYGAFLLSVTATGKIVRSPPSIVADVGIFGKHTFPLKTSDCDQIIAFLKRANFPILV